MMKKLGKILLFLSTMGAVFAGTYYFMKNKDADAEQEDDFDVLDDEDYEDGEEEEDEDDDENEDEDTDGERSYVSLYPDKDVSDRAKEETPSKQTDVEEFFDDDDDNDHSLNAI